MKIINFGQIVDLEHGTQISHQMTVELPDGNRTQVRIHEDTVQQLVDAVTGAEEKPQYRVPERDPAEVFPPESLEERDPGEVNFDEGVFGVMEEEEVEDVGEPVPGLGQGPKVRARSVAKDELGYPIVHSTGGTTSMIDEVDEDDGTQI